MPIIVGADPALSNPAIGIYPVFADLSAIITTELENKAKVTETFAIVGEAFYGPAVGSIDYFKDCVIRRGTLQELNDFALPAGSVGSDITISMGAAGASNVSTVQNGNKWTLTGPLLFLRLPSAALQMTILSKHFNDKGWDLDATDVDFNVNFSNSSPMFGFGQNAKVAPSPGPRSLLNYTRCRFGRSNNTQGDPTPSLTRFLDYAAFTGGLTQNQKMLLEINLVDCSFIPFADPDVVDRTNIPFEFLKNDFAAGPAPYEKNVILNVVNTNMAPNKKDPRLLAFVDLPVCDQDGFGPTGRTLYTATRDCQSEWPIDTSTTLGAFHPLDLPAFFGHATPGNFWDNAARNNFLDLRPWQQEGCPPRVQAYFNTGVYSAIPWTTQPKFTNIVLGAASAPVIAVAMKRRHSLLLFNPNPAKHVYYGFAPGVTPATGIKLPAQSRRRIDLGDNIPLHAVGDVADTNFQAVEVA